MKEKVPVISLTTFELVWWLGVCCWTFFAYLTMLTHKGFSDCLLWEYLLSMEHKLHLYHCVFSVFFLAAFLIFWSFCCVWSSTTPSPTVCNVILTTVKIFFLKISDNAFTRVMKVFYHKAYVCLCGKCLPSNEHHSFNFFVRIL